MEVKTKINAEEGKQDLTITREFDLPLNLLFKAYSEAELVEQWMGTNVLKFDNKKHGSYQFETKHQGNVVFRANGVIHEFIPNQKITRTFEMETVSFGVQLEIHQFEKITENTSKIIIHTIFETVAVRDQMLKLPFKQGINMAHNRLQEIVTNLK
ncbi:MAG TPA: SRPBCC domain-containing protein [Flavobacterium sp.]|nr:SRPBCC domain-containing protein [Flavobacterium sp.]